MHTAIYRGVSRQKCANLRTARVDPERVSGVHGRECLHFSGTRAAGSIAAVALSEDRLITREREIFQPPCTHSCTYTLGVCILISLPRIHTYTNELVLMPPRLINDAQMMKMNRFCLEPLCALFYVLFTLGAATAILAPWHFYVVRAPRQLFCHNYIYPTTSNSIRCTTRRPRPV